MNRESIQRLLREVARGRQTPAQAMKRLESLPYQDLGFAKVDHHRALRKSYPEVIYGPGKTPQQLREIMAAIFAQGDDVLATRVEPAAAEVVVADPRLKQAVYHTPARILTLQNRKPKSVGEIAVLAAGTSDRPVAEEARVSAEAMGNKVTAHYDVGVAGIHRLLDRREALQSARVLIVVAGMEGALPSVVGGLVDRPVIAVPTSVGYGANFGGLAALLGMLNSCASGVTVVNIDNGYGAAHAASLINRRK